MALLGAGWLMYLTYSVGEIVTLTNNERLTLTILKRMNKILVIIICHLVTCLILAFWVQTWKFLPLTTFLHCVFYILFRIYSRSLVFAVSRYSLAQTQNLVPEATDQKDLVTNQIHELLLNIFLKWPLRVTTFLFVAHLTVAVVVYLPTTSYFQASLAVLSSYGIILISDLVAIKQSRGFFLKDKE